jgi:hypothetical protein
MTLPIRANSRLRADLGPVGVGFLEHGIAGLTRILPHVETLGWKLKRKSAPTSVTFTDENKRQLRLVLGLRLTNSEWTIRGTLQRRKVPAGKIGSISRTISNRERDLSLRVLDALGVTLGPASKERAVSLAALQAGFDERVVAAHLIKQHHLQIDLDQWFVALRRLAEQTYENKALAFGCVIASKNRQAPAEGKRFPQDFLDRKRYRALSDGYRSGYRVSARGALLGLVELGRGKPEGSRFYPEWCEDLATEARSGRLGIALTRQGDLLVFDDGHLTFTYRFGRWQFWNHAHLVDLVRNAARVQNVPPKLLSGVVRAIYRAALDVSFRRTGGLFVVLRSRKRLRDVAPRGEAVGDSARDELDEIFDKAVGRLKVQSVSRCVLAELAGLDGAVVLGNNGEILAYGAILDPKRKGRVAGTEGSRSKAAIGASYSGLAVKISSDGDITVYVEGDKLFSI